MEYPTAVIIMNASNETLIGKVIIDNPADVEIPKYMMFQFKDNELSSYKEDPSNFMLEVMTEKDPFNFGELFLSLPNPSSVLDKVDSIIDQLCLE